MEKNGTHSAVSSIVVMCTILSAEFSLVESMKMA